MRTDHTGCFEGFSPFDERTKRAIWGRLVDGTVEGFFENGNVEGK